MRSADISKLTTLLPNLPTIWEGKECVLELKAVDYNWRQMEWWAFYFEFKARELLKDAFTIPGDKYDTVRFDLKGEINWDFKSHAIKGNSHSIILNDKSAMEQSITAHGKHGEIIALCDVEYNDHDRSFQKWHSELKGGKSKYEAKREARTSCSRYRKTRAELVEIVLVTLDADALKTLPTMRQGINSNGKPRPEKYMLDLEKLNAYGHRIIKL